MRAEAGTEWSPCQSEDMSERDKVSNKTIRIKSPKQRVRTTIKTGTVVHKSPKVYTRKEKHKKSPRDADHEESE